MAKSLNLCLFLWAFGGFFGLHHLYLGRDRHFLLWFCSLGGFLVGWVADLCRIPGYVAQANCSPSYAAGWEARRGRKIWDVPFSRILGSFVFAIYFEIVTVYGIDAYQAFSIFPSMLIFIKVLVRALAIHVCFSIGEKTCSSRVVFLCSLVSELLLRTCLYLFSNERLGYVPGDAEKIWVVILSQLPLTVTICSAVLNHSYREEKKSFHFCVRFPTLLLCISVWLLFLISAMYHHLEVPTSRNSSESKMLKEVLTDFGTSESYSRMIAARSMFLKLRQDQGFRFAAEEMARHFGLLNRHPTIGNESKKQFYDLNCSISTHAQSPLSSQKESRRFFSLPRRSLKIVKLKIFLEKKVNRLSI